MAYSEDHTALAAEYALGTLDADERALVETMMIVDHGFKDLVDAWDRKLAPLHQMVEAVEPSADLWDRIKAASGVGVVQVAAASEAITPESATTDLSATAPATAGLDRDQLVASGEPEIAPVTRVAADNVAEDREEIAEAPSPRAVPQAPSRRASLYGLVMTAIAALLAAVVALQVYRPELLPETLRIKPQVKVVEIKTPAPPVAAQFVAVLQQGGATQPAFILTVDRATRRLTARRLGAALEPDKSYELWLVSDRLPQPRSLGVIGEAEFTSGTVLQAYDSDVVSKATYAVTIEPKGGSPTGVASGPIVYTGKLVENVPAGAASAR